MVVQVPTQRFQFMILTRVVLLADDAPLGNDGQKVIDPRRSIAGRIASSTGAPCTDDRQQVVDVRHAITVAVGGTFRLQAQLIGAFTAGAGAEPRSAHVEAC